ncbi:MAG: multiheme c-type cytochrome, partial [Acidobacteria bacterium]|nr:multiheme c-type cytochrome [Acidobacteriota bacterium]
MARVRTDQADPQASTAARLREFVLWLFVAGAAASAVDLVVLGHFEDARQWVPLVLLPAGLLVVAWHRVRPGYPGARVLQATMALFIASGVIGLWFHYAGNLAFELEMQPSMAGWELLRETLSGATPTLAPALMVQLGLLGLIYTYRHPVLERRPIDGRPALRGAPERPPAAATPAGRRVRAGRILTAVLAGAVGCLAASASVAAASGEPAADVHAALFAEERFPSATTCAGCHAEIYREWSVSAHAYAQLSPVLNAMQAKIGKLTNGTNGDFCVRCHTPVGMQLGEPTFLSTLDRHPASREGVTCIVCHRQDQAHGKISGRLPLVEGSLYDPVFGPGGNAELRRLIETGDLNLQTEPERPGRAVHAEARSFLRLPQPGMCGSCHDVSFVNGFRLEEAFSEYKLSPAAGRGVTCQDCHMGTEPGVPAGYATGPAARVGGRATRARKRTNHMFAGPDHSIVHPGIFPHNPEAQEFATLREWLAFDHEAGWGTDAFEAAAADDHAFPPRWAEPDDRYDARDIIQDNLDLLAEMDEQRRAVLRAGYRLGDVVVERADGRGLAFRVEFRNGTDGHNVPTGFDAERLVWLHVTVTDAAGTVVFESGDLDPNGDVRDSHSVYVHDGALPADQQLFSLQSRFLVRMVRGGEREQVLAVPYSPSPLVFARPATRATVLTGRPVNARKHRRTIPPGGSAWASYSVGADALAGTAGPYHATIRIKAGMVPVNLVHEIADVGFDYGMTERQVAEAVVAGHVVVR